jgi:hypothetical protein
MVSPAAAPGDIFGTGPSAWSGTDVVATSLDGLVGDGADVAEPVVSLLGTLLWLTVDASTSRKPGLDRSGSDATNPPWLVGGLKRRTYLVSLASSAVGGSDVTSLRLPSCARFTAPFVRVSGPVLSRWKVR